MSAAATATLAIPRSVISLTSLAKPHFSERHLNLYNLYTKEDFEGVYWRDGHYTEEAIHQLTHLLRDRRNGKTHPIDPKLFDLLHQLSVDVDASEPFQVICGFRSPATNKKLRQTRKGVAKNSLHMKGKALDINLSNIKLSELRNAARALKAGGVGYYPKSRFIHVDIRPKPAYWG